MTTGERINEIMLQIYKEWFRPGASVKQVEKLELLKI
jgi:hypothetical protein